LIRIKPAVGLLLTFVWRVAIGQFELTEQGQISALW
jgi:hypothetical protein